jgi:hypothetical protein
LNDGSTAMMSGSQKYVVGAPRGLKSRGGVVTVDGGAAGPPWAIALPAPAIVAPAAIAAPWMSVLREIIDTGSRTSRVITSSQCLCRPVDPAWPLQD